MARQVDRRTMTRWLLDHGFTKIPDTAGGHVHYERQGVRITLMGHGPTDLTKKHLGLIVRQLERLGFERTVVRRELGEGW